MSNYLKSEWLKQKRTFSRKLIWAAPVCCTLISFLLMGGEYVQTAGYNWWYLLFLPFTFIYISGTAISREKKYNYHGLFALCEKKERIWYGKIGVLTGNLILTSLVFCLVNIVCIVLFGAHISVSDSIIAGLCLIVAFAWQIPLFMLITLKSNVYLSVFLGVVCNFGIACICAAKTFWWVPFAIPARLMCPVLGVHPNGLILEAESPLRESSVILPGLLIALVLYILLSVISAGVFKEQEV